MKPSEIESMSVSEKLQAIETLWDALDEDEIESPAWHSEALAERKRLIASGNAKFISLEALKRHPH